MRGVPAQPPREWELDSAQGPPSNNDVVHPAGLPAAPRVGLALNRSCTYTVSAMKNITLSVDEGVIRTVRLYAAERDSTVNALVREFLTELANREDRVRKARERIAELSDRSSARIGSRTWTREELHER